MECTPYRTISHSCSTSYGAKTVTLAVQPSDYFHANVPCRPSSACCGKTIHDYVLLYPTLRRTAQKGDNINFGQAVSANFPD
jgi:hypothetical protein